MTAVHMRQQMTDCILTHMRLMFRLCDFFFSTVSHRMSCSKYHVSVHVTNILTRRSTNTLIFSDKILWLFCALKNEEWLRLLLLFVFCTHYRGYCLILLAQKPFCDWFTDEGKITVLIGKKTLPSCYINSTNYILSISWKDFVQKQLISLTILLKATK